ncbi:hypothetical protein Ocin01_17624 [Orchesella cincta]|uniref:Uncharacterized protein n=1 Tax=Orchesella cincta TaxID=48709 RepID=A0A1D2M7U9_ORCCI|nr:hypothetical protein Ocin01_17624 [Orchesella cincta]
MLQAKFQYKASFLQRSASVASLVAWKDRFDKISVKKQASFVSYTSGSDDDSEDWTPTEAPLNDDPPSYPEVTAPEEDNAVTGCSKIKLAACTQDFTALENYFKKKLSIKRSPSTKQTCEDARRMRESVYNWINELPEGNNLEEFLEAYGIPVDGVDMEDFKLRLKAFLDERLSGVNLDAPPPPPPMPEEMPKLHRQKQLKILEELAHEDNLEKWLESLDVPFFRPIPETKDEIRKYLKLKPEGPLVLPPQVVVNPDNVPNTAAYVPKWQELVEKMRDLKNEDELDKWLEDLEVPCNVPTAKVKAEIKKFFMHETFDTFPGKSPIFQEKNLARDLWEKFEDAGLLKQVALIAGTTAALGVLAVVSTTLLSFAMPAAFVAGTPYFTEVFAQYFLQRQEVCFNLLNFHAQNAKPLSTAWAKQYILWKYC